MLNKTLMAFAALLSFASLAGAQDRITNFHSLIAVQPDNSTLQITETIDFTLDVGQSLYRNMSEVKVGTPLGLDRYFRNNMAITCDGRQLQASVKSSDPYWDIKVFWGNPEEKLSPGPHQCELSYRVDGAFYNNDGEDRLYWRATGSWPMPVEKASVEVVLPEDGRAKSLLAHSGYQGVWSDTHISGQTAHGMYFETTEPLPVGEEMIVQMDLEKRIAPAGGGFEKGAILEVYDDSPATSGRGSVPFFMGGGSKTSSSHSLMDALGPMAMALKFWDILIRSVIFNLVAAIFLMIAIKIVVHSRPGYWRCFGVLMLAGVVGAALLIGISMGSLALMRSGSSPLVILPIVSIIMPIAVLVLYAFIVGRLIEGVGFLKGLLAVFLTWVMAISLMLIFWMVLMVMIH